MGTEVTADDDMDARSSAADYADAVVEQIHLIRRLYQAHLSRAYSDASREMVYMSGRILDYVARHPGCSQSDVASSFDRDKGQIAKVVANLRDQGLIMLEVSQADRRRQKIVLTDKGRQIRLQSQKERDHVARLGVANMDASERRALLALLSRMRQNLESEPK